MTDTMTLEQIRRKGLELLARELGPVGFIRFLQMFDSGSGDYTSERFQWLEASNLIDLTEQLKEREKHIKSQED